MLDRQTGVYTLVTRAHANWFGEAALKTSTFGEISSVSNDGRYVAFASSATNLIEEVGQGLLYLYDVQTDIMSRVIDGVGSPQLTPFAFSSDGQFLTFGSNSNGLVVGDSNNKSDVFLYNLQTKTTTLISVDSGGVVGGSDGRSWNPVISADGKFITYSSDATNLVAGDDNSQRDIFVRDLQAEQTFRVSVNSSAEQGNGFSEGQAISENGRYVTFYSMASNLVDSDTNSAQDIFLHDRQSGVTTRVSVDSNGNEVGDFSSSISNPSISLDGQFVAFVADAAGLVDGDLNEKADLFVHDNESGAIIRVSENVLGEDGDGHSGFYSTPVFTENGAFLIFNSEATNLVDGDNNGFGDIFRARNLLAPFEPLGEDIFGGPITGSFEKLEVH
jgi:Tol biopolymer transport system component